MMAARARLQRQGSLFIEFKPLVDGSQAQWRTVVYKQVFALPKCNPVLSCYLGEVVSLVNEDVDLQASTFLLTIKLRIINIFIENKNIEYKW